MMIARATQTNEPARCAALLPVLARLDGPLALVEVGASAGLCLYPDKYSYEYDGRQVGARSPVHLASTTTGDMPLPDRLPHVVARVGIDLNPLDPADRDDRSWLRALVWPGPLAEDRLRRLDAAAELAGREPARMLRGDLMDRLPDAVDLVAGRLHRRGLPHRRAAPTFPPNAGTSSSTSSGPCRCGGSPRRRPESCRGPVRRRRPGG